MKKHALRLTPTDNVATALEEIEAKDLVQIVDADGNDVFETEALTPIPRGHKIALQDFPEGASVVKYGYQIGLTTKPVTRGVHVHTDNLVSARGRGDL